MAQRTVNNPPFDYRFKGNVAGDITELFSLVGGGSSPLSGYQMVAGVIRNTGSGWGIIDDVDHTPLNIDGVSNDTSTITIDHSSIGASEVVSLIVAPDETYAGVYDFGSSVGVDSTAISIKTRTRDVVNGTVTHTGNGAFTKSGTITSVAYDSGTGILTVTHPTCGANWGVMTDLADTDGNITQWKTFGNSLSSTQMQYKMFNLDGTQKTLLNPEINRANFTREVEKENLTVSGINPNNVAEVTGNIWIIGLFKI